MKHAYVSIVLPMGTPPEEIQLLSLDKDLAAQCQAHEIIAVVPHSCELPNYDALQLTGPLSVVTTHMRATPDSSLISGLARAVGDFIIEWRGPIEHLDSLYLTALLEPSNEGIELVEVTGTKTSRTSRSFYWLVNRLRPSYAPVRKTVARVYSRHGLGQVLSAATFEPQIDILTAELPVSRLVWSTTVPTPQHDSLFHRIGLGCALLSKGTRFGSAFPLTLAALSATFGVGAAVYALIILFVQGTTPEGWTTLMVVAGLGQAAILAMLGLIWTRIEALSKGFSRNNDATAAVRVVAPKSTESSKPSVH